MGDMADMERDNAKFAAFEQWEDSHHLNAATCKYCGTRRLYWQHTEDEGWGLHTAAGRRHYCLNGLAYHGRDIPVAKRTDVVLLQALQGIKFEFDNPRPPLFNLNVKYGKHYPIKILLEYSCN